MAFDSQLEVSGKHTHLDIMDERGLLARISVVDFSVAPNMSEIQVKPIGRSGSNNGQEFDSYGGSFNINFSDQQVEDFIDDIILSSIVARAKAINLIVTTIYNNGQVRSYKYGNCKLTFDKSVTRGDAQTIAVNWISGEDRELVL